ncbi:homeobox protein DLX-4-like [Tachyglossus aculeatus]|uniref:homeobox protein DLX-4-like n=1 Tax=Tachyglossus aculeatus TaxID=9261 RepID=UPI0018F2F648|nr:homeobox protein DLX-4-like [Tachyglossus aculeatus]
MIEDYPDMQVTAAEKEPETFWSFSQGIPEVPMAPPPIQPPLLPATPRWNPEGSSCFPKVEDQWEEKTPKKPTEPKSYDKRKWVRFSDLQLSTLRSRFKENILLTPQEARQLASELGLTRAQILSWFRNHRKKFKKLSVLQQKNFRK